MSDGSLPTELISVVGDYVLDGCQEDNTNASLYASTLVCKHWYLVFRYYVWCRTIITSRPGELAQFEDFLRASPGLGNNVQHLIITGLDKDEDGEGRDSLPWLPLLSKNLPEMLPELYTIEFTHIREGEGDFQPQGFLEFSKFSEFCKVRTLLFRHCHLSLPVIFSITSRFSDLVHFLADGLFGSWQLEYENFEKFNGEKEVVFNPTPSPFRCPDRIRCVMIRHTDDPFILRILEWMAASPSVNTIEYLTLEIETKCDLVGVAAFIRRLGPQCNFLDLKQDRRVILSTTFTNLNITSKETGKTHTYCIQPALTPVESSLVSYIHHLGFRTLRIGVSDYFRRGLRNNPFWRPKEQISFLYPQPKPNLGRYMDLGKPGELAFEDGVIPDMEHNEFNVEHAMISMEQNLYAKGREV